MMKTHQSRNSSKSRFYFIATVLVVVTSLVQVFIIESSLENVYAALLLFSMSLVSIRYLKSLRILSFPNSFLILIGFVIGLCLMPLLFRTFEAKSLVGGLHEPFYTFASTSLIILLTLFSHYIYVKTPYLVRFRKIISKALIPYLGLTPKLALTLFMSLIGLLALFISAGFDGPLSKIIKSIAPLCNVPFALYLLLYIKSQANSTLKGPSRLLLIIVIALFFVSIIIGFSFNSRFAFIQPLILALGALIFVYLGLNNSFSLKFIMSAVLSLIIMLPLLNTLSQSVALARAYRQSVSPAELLSLTFDNFMKPEANFSIYSSGSLWWNEQYYQSEFLNRFSTVKMIDNTLYISGRMDNAQSSEYQNFQLTRFISTLPNPLPSFLGVSAAQKEEANQFSSADVLFGFISETTEGRRLTGSFISDSYALFGLLSPFIYILLLLLLFPISDLFTIPLGESKDLLIPSCLGILLIPEHLLLFSSGSLVDLSAGYVRSVVQVSLAFGLFLLPPRFNNK